MFKNQYSTGPVATKLYNMERLERFKREKKLMFDTLTPREVKVLVMVSGGNNNPEIAEILGITRATVQNHRAAIREKLGIKSEIEYYKFALAFDLIAF